MEAGDSALIRRLALLSLAGQLTWLLFVVVAGALEPGYSAARDAISFLGADTAARPWSFDLAVAIWGASFLAAAGALALDAPRTLRGQLGPALIGLTGVAQILVGFPFPLDCRETIDAGCQARELAGQVSWRHQAHGWAFVVGLDALVLSVFAMAWRFRGDPRWGRADLFALGCGLIGLAVFAVLLVFGDDGSSGHYGLVQRLALAAGGCWVALLMGGLLMVHRETGAGATKTERLAPP